MRRSHHHFRVHNYSIFAYPRNGIEKEWKSSIGTLQILFFVLSAPEEVQTDEFPIDPDVSKLRLIRCLFTKENSCSFRPFFNVENSCKFLINYHVFFWEQCFCSCYQRFLVHRSSNGGKNSRIDLVPAGLHASVCLAFKMQKSVHTVYASLNMTFTVNVHYDRVV